MIQDQTQHQICRVHIGDSKRKEKWEPFRFKEFKGKVVMIVDEEYLRWRDADTDC